MKATNLDKQKSATTKSIHKPSSQKPHQNIRRILLTKNIDKNRQTKNHNCIIKCLQKNTPTKMNINEIDISMKNNNYYFSDS